MKLVILKLISSLNLCHRDFITIYYLFCHSGPNERRNWKRRSIRQCILSTISIATAKSSTVVGRLKLVFQFYWWIPIFLQWLTTLRLWWIVCIWAVQPVPGIQGRHRRRIQGRVHPVAISSVVISERHTYLFRIYCGTLILRSNVRVVIVCFYLVNSSFVPVLCVSFIASTQILFVLMMSFCFCDLSDIIDLWCVVAMCFIGSSCLLRTISSILNKCTVLFLSISTLHAVFYAIESRLFTANDSFMFFLLCGLIFPCGLELFADVIVIALITVGQTMQLFSKFFRAS